MGEYGDIASRAAFHADLDKCIALSDKLKNKFPGHPGLESISPQLAEMQRTTTDRDPSPDERQKIDVGLVVVRELEGWPDDDVMTLGQLIHPVAAFYEDWPTDEVAAREAAG